MLLQAIAEYGLTNSSLSLGARINGAARWVGSEVTDIAESASRNPGMTTVVVAVILALLIARALAAQ